MQQFHQENQPKRGSSINATKEREFKNQQTFQQCFVLGLLNNYATITLERPGKQSKMTITMPIVQSVTLNKEEIPVKEIAIQQCQLIKKEELRDGVLLKTINRREKKNVSAYIQNFIIDICYECGIDFESKLSKQSNKSIQIERIEKITQNENVILKNDVMKFGEEMNKYLLSLLNNKKKVVVKKNDKNIQKIMNECFVQIPVTNSPNSLEFPCVSSSFMDHGSV